MTPELRDRLIALIERMHDRIFDGDYACLFCSSRTDTEHHPDCELAACLAELRALQSMPYLELDENSD